MSLPEYFPQGFAGREVFDFLVNGVLPFPHLPQRRWHKLFVRFRFVFHASVTLTLV
jgi:hypothetical protein